MAQLLKLKPFILKWEGGYCNDPDDRGGATNMGVTIATFRTYFGQDKTVADLKAMTDEQWMRIFADGFWNPCHADEIANQALANIIVDMAFNSGTKTPSAVCNPPSVSRLMESLAASRWASSTQNPVGVSIGFGTCARLIMNPSLPATRHKRNFEGLDEPFEII